MKFGCCISSAHYDLVAANGYSSIAFPGVELAGASDAEFESIAAKVASWKSTASTASAPAPCV